MKGCPICNAKFQDDVTTCEKCNIELMDWKLAESIYLYGYDRIKDKHPKEYQTMIRYRQINGTKGTYKNSSDIVQSSQSKSRPQVADTSSSIFTIIGILIVIIVFGYLISLFTSPSESKYTCARCNKTFTDSANTKSIAYSNFCEKCHDDVEFLKEVQDAIE